MSDTAERDGEATAVAVPRSGSSSNGNAEPAHRYGSALAAEIEQRWQQTWRERGTYASPNPAGRLSDSFDTVAGKPSFFVLDMFPYPSGTGLHVGHPLGYIGTDVYARYLRMTGYNVLHPFGYDAFGLPAEQFAINTGQHPRVTTDANIANMRRQLSRLGLGHDTRREIATTDVDYYRWTQWIFLKIFNSWYDTDAGRARPVEELEAEFAAGTRAPVSSEANPDGLPWDELSPLDRRRVVDSYRLAFISEQMVNWCPGLGTVLANEEVTPDGRSDIGNYPVFRRPLKQWMMRITAYAERLIADLDLVDWPDSIKQMQRNWIGSSDGASVDFTTLDGKTRVEVYTTRPDTLAGATFMVLAPEHPLVDTLTAQDWPANTPETWRFTAARRADAEADPARWTPSQAVDAYREFAARRSDRQRGDTDVRRTGVFTGAYVVNPVGGAHLPVFLADYVLMGYGTGAIMAVPAHDQRDFSFARELGLPIPPVLAPTPDWLAEHGLSEPTHNADRAHNAGPTDAAGLTDTATWPEAFSGEGEYLPPPAGAPSLVGLSKPDGIKATVRWLEDVGAGRARRSYRLRDWLFSRQRYWGEPFPIVFDDDGLPAAVPDDLLPVTLPEMTDFRPTAVDDDDTSEPIPPLARAKEWVSVTLDLGDGPKSYRRETNTMPQWAGSCWYYLRYLDPTNTERFVDPAVERYWMQSPDDPDGDGDGGVDLYVGGVEHAVLHLLYARFWHKVLYDLGLVSTKEPFKRLFNQGYIQADAFTDSRGMYVPAAEVRPSADGGFVYDGEPVTRRSGKMGKSLKNSISPDEMCDAYGADTLRVYEMAMGPLEADRPWRTDDVIGSYRFLQRLWRNIIDETSGEPLVVDEPLDDDALRAMHRTILAVRADYAGLRFNTAVARLIELTNYVSKRYARSRTPRALAETLTLMVAPLAPHIAEELWARLGHRESVVYQPFPEGDEALATESSVTLPVQVNGKVRFTLEVPAAADEATVRALLANHDDYARHVGDRTVKRVIVVPGRIVNIALG